MSAKCSIHHDKEAYNICHSCGKSFCKECLTEGVQYYYCQNEECQKEFEKELIPEKIVCPECSHDIQLTLNERIERKFHCPNCEATIDYNLDEYKVTETEEFVEALSTLNLGDVALIKSILDDNEIDYYTTDENFSSIYPLVQPVKFFVHKEQFPDAMEALKDFKLHVFGLPQTANDKEEE